VELLYRNAPVGIHFDLSRSDLERLLADFIVGTQRVKLDTRFLDHRELPPEFRKLLVPVLLRGCVWTAWATKRGPIAVWAHYDIHGSKAINAYLLYVEWYLNETGHHSLWCHCHPDRSTEWTIGRGRTQRC
jgi:hypothetical protein